jgi:modulator of FtsH protease HflC
MMNFILRKPIHTMVTAFALLIIASLTFFVVPETGQALVLRNGQPVRVINAYKPNVRFGQTNAGVGMRIPVFEQVLFVDKRILTVNMDSQQVQSTDDLRLEVDAYARFRIVNPMAMYRTIRNENALSEQLQSLLGSALRNELGKREFAALLSAERGTMMENIQKSLNAEAKRYGAEIVDVRIKRADLPKGAPLESVYNRMRSERELRANTILAEGRKEAAIITGNGRAEAAKIYAASFGKDADFYDFYRAMQSYEATLVNNKDAQTQVILSPENDYLRRFKGK